MSVSLDIQGYRMETAIIILVVLLGTLVLLLAAGAVYQITGTWRDRRRFPPPGRLGLLSCDEFTTTLELETVGTISL